MVQNKESLPSRIVGQILGRRLNVQTALRTTGAQIPDDIDPAAITTMITELPDDQLRKTAAVLRLRTTRHDQKTDFGLHSFYTVKIPQRLGFVPERLLPKRMFYASFNALSNYDALRETLLNLHQKDEYALPVEDTLSLRKSRQNIIDKVLGTTPYSFQYAVDYTVVPRREWVYGRIRAFNQKEAKLKLQEKMNKIIEKAAKSKKG